MSGTPMNATLLIFPTPIVTTGFSPILEATPCGC